MTDQRKTDQMTAQEMPPETCPECGARMKPSREPLRISTKYVGTYDAMCCPVCKFYYFTEKEYDKALEDAEALGLGPQRRMVVSVGLQELVKDLPKVTAASSMEINIGQ